MKQQKREAGTSLSDVILQVFQASLLFSFAVTLFCVARGKRVSWDVSLGLFALELALAFICFLLFAAGTLALSKISNRHSGALVIRALYLAFPVLFGFHWLIEVTNPINRHFNLFWYLLVTGILVALWVGHGLMMHRRSTKIIGPLTLAYWLAFPIVSMLCFTLYLHIDILPHRRFPFFYALYAFIFAVTGAFVIRNRGREESQEQWPSKWFSGLAGMIAAAGILASCAYIKGKTLDLFPEYSPPQTQRISKEGPNIIMISLDTLRADHLSCYGYGKNTSPNLDRLAAQGAVFEYAIAQAPWTLPSHSSLFTSRYPYQLESALIQETPSLAEILKTQGYSTIAFTGGDFMSARNFGKHFDFFDDESEELYHIRHQCLVTTALRLRLFARRFGFSAKHLNIFNNWRFRGPNLRVARASFAVQRKNASRWLREHGRENSFFLFLHTYAIHDYFLNRTHARNNAEKFNPGYDGLLKGVSLDYHSTYPREKKDIDQIIALYDGEILDADNELGKLVRDLQELDLWNNTLIVLFSDHGEGFDPDLHRLWHGDRLNHDLLRVPLIFVYPGRIPEGKVVSSPVALLDLMPTILDLADIEIPEDIEGVSKKRIMQDNQSKAGSSHVYSEVAGVDTSGVSLRSDLYKYIKYPHYIEFYALADDPQERINLAPVAPEAMRSIQPLIDDFFKKAAQKTSYDQETLDRMRAVGYLQ
jgi:arylsulfatase A-like enzyme